MPAPRVLVVQLADSDPPALLEPWLVRAGAAAHLVRASDLPADVDGFDALIVLGGPMAAVDDAQHAFLPAVRDLLRTAVREEIPTLGICPGAQLLALAHGGRVERNPDGPELGAQLIAKRTAASTDPLFGPVPITPDVVQWHFDAVTTLPPGAVLLAGSPTCEVQAFRLGRLAWGVQFHIEATPDVVRRWAAADAPVLAEYDLDRIVERVEALQGDVAETWEPFVAAFVDIAREPGAVPAPRGVPTTSAAPITDPAAIRAALAAEVAASRAPLPMPQVRPPAQD